MVRNLTGRIHNSGLGYSYDAVVVDGFVKAMTGKVPNAIANAVETQRYLTRNNSLTAMFSTMGTWVIFDTERDKIVVADNGGFIGIE